MDGDACRVMVKERKMVVLRGQATEAYSFNVYESVVFYTWVLVCHQHENACLGG
jgi:hypothetical protein